MALVLAVGPILRIGIVQRTGNQYELNKIFVPMALLSLHGIGIRFNSWPVLDNITLHINEGEKVCLLGRNGAGKTTLMKIINGDILPDQGEIRHKQGAKTSRLHQELPVTERGRVYEVITRSLGQAGAAVAAFKKVSAALENTPTGPGHEKLLAELAQVQHEMDVHQAWDIDLKVEKILSQMDLPGQAEYASLSVGLRKRVMLARALISEPDLLILDEPTNHLDLTAIEWLENFLMTYQGTLFFVTHDRAFLKKIATRVVHLDRGELKSYDCGYDAFLQKREEELATEEEHNEQFDKKLAQEEEWLRRGVKARRTRNEGRVKALLKLREIRAARRQVTGNVRLEVQESERSGKKVIEAKQLSFAFRPGCPLIKNFSTIIARGDKVGIIGPNGSGKTTLLKLLLKELSPEQGEILHGTQLAPAYFDQSRQQLAEDLTLEENIAGKNDKIIFNGQARHVNGYLKDFLFTPQQVSNKVQTLSGGEKNRLLLAKLFTQSANLLILDEPTNDLDIETMELLEELLIDFEGTILLVSHDREFLNNVATDVIVFEDEGKVTRHNGGYDDWRAARPVASKTDEGKDTAAWQEYKEQKARLKAEAPKKLSFKEKKELAELPPQIEALEAELVACHEKLADPLFYKQAGDAIKEVQSRLSELQEIITTLYARWEYLESLATDQ